LQAFVGDLRRGSGDASAVLEPVAAELFDKFAAAGVDAVLLKGAALAQLLYGPGEHRPYIDLDVLVSPAHLVRAEEMLSELGYHNAHALRGIDDVGGAVHAETWFAPAGAKPHEIDLHRWLAGARAPRDVAWDALWSRRTTIRVAGRPIPVLNRDGQALHLALHAAQHGRGFFRGITELRLALERWPRSVWQGARALADNLEADAAFATGLRLVPEGAELASGLGLPIASTLEWEMDHRAERPRGTFYVEAFRDANTLRERLSLARRALIPNRRWLAVEYHWSRRGPVWRALAYGLHVARAPVWAARAWAFRRRARRSSHVPARDR
jgi:hypothetical protein